MRLIALMTRGRGYCRFRFDSSDVFDRLPTRIVGRALHGRQSTFHGGGRSKESWLSASAIPAWSLPGLPFAFAWIGRGLSDAAAGLRMRYQCARQSGPYFGNAWRGRFGRTADLARGAGACTNSTTVVEGQHFGRQHVARRAPPTSPIQATWEVAVGCCVQPGSAGGRDLAQTAQHVLKRQWLPDVLPPHHGHRARTVQRQGEDA